jgi:hypothetical protein
MELKQLGLIDRVPRLAIINAAGANTLAIEIHRAPVVEAYFKAKYTCHDERSDLYAYFIERAHMQLKTGGRFGMIVSNKFLRANYGKPLRERCRQPWNPDWRTVYHWMDKDEDFVARIARAREDGHDVIADQCVTLADTQPLDQTEVAWRRLQVETRLKLLAKWNPKKYGDRQQLEHGGGISLNVITGVPDA